MSYITFFGGFHNRGAVRVRVSEKQFESIREGYTPLSEILSKGQYKRLEKHFCGIPGCTCGGPARADVKF